VTTVAVPSEILRDRPHDFSDRIVDLFIDFLREMYRKMDEFTYQDDDRLTRVMIFDKFADNMDAVGQRPAIITDLKGISKGSVAIDDRGGLRHPNWRKGAEYRTDLFSGTLILHNTSSVQWESRRLAFLTGMGITGFEPEIRRKGQIFDVNVPNPVGEPVKLVTSSRGEVWSTPTTVQVSFEETWVRSIIEGELLGKMNIKVVNSGFGESCG
jgi:hypothetical protein